MSSKCILSESIGKYLGVNPALVTMGIERCPEFCDICVDRAHESAVGMIELWLAHILIIESQVMH